MSTFIVQNEDKTKTSKPCAKIQKLFQICKLFRKKNDALFYTSTPTKHLYAFYCFHTVCTCSYTNESDLLIHLLISYCRYDVAGNDY